MLFTQHTIHHKFIAPALVVLFMLLSVVGFGQSNDDCPGCQDCTNFSHPIFSAWGLPDTVCADQVIPFSIGYNDNNTIVIAPQEEDSTQPESMFISDGVPCNGDNCTYSSPITFSGYSGHIIDSSSIKYVRLNIEYEYADQINIKLRCPNDQSVNILYHGGEGSQDQCSHTPEGTWINRQNSIGYLYDDVFWIVLANFGVPVTDQNTNPYDPCDISLHTHGTGWNYCWSNNINNNYAFDDGRIYRNINGNNNIINNISYSLDSTHISSNEQFYHPDQSFSQLAGCPINGTWTIEIFDFQTFDTYNGYLFDWEIVFDDDVLIPAGNSVDSAAVIIPNSNGQMDEQYFSYGNSDTTFIFNAPIVSHNTTITDSLRLFDPATGCWYDTVFQITVLAPKGTRHDPIPICAGGSATLAADCNNSKFSEDFDEIDTGGDTWHSHSNNNQTHDGPGSNEISENENILSNFPTRTKVFPAGGKVKLGNTQHVIGSMESIPIDLNYPFSVLVRAKGWGVEATSSTPPKKTKVNVIVDKGQSTQQEQSFETDPPYHWPGTDAYRDYSLSFNSATSNSTITVETENISNYDTRAFVDYVVTKNEGCTYLWSDGTDSWGNDSTNSTITVSPQTTTTYYVTVTPPDGGCVRVDTFMVVVNPLPEVSITVPSDICPNVGTVDITANIQTATAASYTYTWTGDNITFSPNPSTSESTTNTVSATIPPAPGSCGQSYPISVSVMDGNGCVGEAEGNIVVRDLGAPVITGTLQTLSVNGCSENDKPEAYTTVDELEAAGLDISGDCTYNSDLSVTSSDSPVSGDCIKTLIRTYTVTNVCGKFSTVPQTITINMLDFAAIMPDNGGTTVSCPALAVAPTLPEVNDNCGNPLTGVLKSGYPTELSGCEGDIVYKYAFTDCEGNADVHVHDRA